jgi:hypothetical protein
VSNAPDLDKMNALTRRLERLCEEGRRLRERIRELASERPIWPERNDIARLFMEDSSSSDSTA